MGRRVPPSLYPPSPGAPEALAWQEAAVSFEASKLGRPLLGGRGQPTKFSVALWAQWELPSPGGVAEGAWIPLSKHRGMMWSFDLGTEGARADPRSHEVHVRVCLPVRENRY